MPATACGAGWPMPARRGVPGSAGVARLAALHHRRAAGGASRGGHGRSRTCRTPPARRPATGRPATTTREASAPVPPATTKPGPPATEASRMRRRSIAEVLTGAVVLLVAAGFLGYAVAHSGRSTASGYTLYAKFDHIDGLGVGADVRLAGVKVGSVNQRADRSEELPGGGVAVGARRHQAAEGHRRDHHQREPARRQIPLAAARRRRDDVAAGADHHHYPVLGQSRGTLGQVHLQHDQRAEGRRGSQPGAQKP